jgi:hypothetical protein
MIRMIFDDALQVPAVHNKILQFLDLIYIKFIDERK